MEKPTRPQQKSKMLLLVKHYLEFVCTIKPRKLSETFRNIYKVEENKFVSTCYGSHYMFLDKKIIVVSMVTPENPLDLKPIRNRVRSVTGERVLGRSTRFVFETVIPIPMCDPVLGLDMTHSRLVKKDPPGLVLNIFEPSVNPNLILKFSEYSDGFTCTFHVQSTGKCHVVCDTSTCGSSEDVCRKRLEPYFNLF